MQETQPLSLDLIEGTGALRFGEPVTKVVLFLRDGRRVVVDVPVRSIAPEDSQGTRYEGVIIDLFVRMGEDACLKGAQVASLLKEDLNTLKKHLAGLVKKEILLSGRTVRGSPGRGGGGLLPTAGDCRGPN